jgi:para-nitrobenzyl esterase
VLVWIHGGGFAIGHGGASIYDGDWLAQTADVVVVTLNYRLGDLGWLWHPGLAPGPGAPAGNWGLLDQLEALRWVQRNIAAFGGDPARVTLAGQSAGALSAMDLLVCPPAAGLFQKVVLHSPPLGDLAQSPEAAIAWAQAMNAACGGDAADDDLAALRTARPGEIVEAHERLLDDPAWRGTRGGALPTLDAAVLSHSPHKQPGVRPEVDVLIGSTADEGTFFFGAPWRPAPPAERIAGIVGHLCHTDAPGAVLETYRARARAAARPDDDHSLLIAIATDAMIAVPAAEWANARASAGGVRAAGAAGAATTAPSPGRVFRYVFAHPSAGPQLRATHTAEVPLLFGTWRDGGPGERLGGQLPERQLPDPGAVAAELVRAWTGFIHEGDPGWPAIAPSEAAGGADEPHVFGPAGARPGTGEPPAPEGA